MSEIQKTQSLDELSTNRQSIFKQMASFKEGPILLAFIILCIVISLLSSYFLTVNNIFNVLRQFSVIAILAVGQALIIITGGIDLSVGALLGLMGVVTALMATTGMPAYAILVVCIIIGCLIGSVNGLLVTKARINPFIVTLGMMSIYKGVSLLLTGGLPISIDNSIVFLGSGYLGPIPIPVILMISVALIGYFFVTKTVIGRNIYAIGNNERAAKLSGIRVDRVKIIVFIIMGALCALAGIISSGTLATAEPTAGVGQELDVIAAVVIGGASLAGGRGSILGVILGAAIMGVLRNGFVLLQISAYWQVVAIGAVIILAVGLDSLKRRN